MALNKLPVNTTLKSHRPEARSVSCNGRGSGRRFLRGILAISPDRKRSASSSKGLMFNGFSDIISMVKMARRLSSSHPRTPGCAHGILKGIGIQILQNLHSRRRPSARIINTSSGTSHTRSRRRMVKLLQIHRWSAKNSVPTRSITSGHPSFMLPELAWKLHPILGQGLKAGIFRSRTSR